MQPRVTYSGIVVKDFTHAKDAKAHMQAGDYKFFMYPTLQGTTVLGRQSSK